MSNIEIAGIGAYLPSLVVTNDKISELVETNHEWIVQRTGISERRISEGETIAAKSVLCKVKLKKRTAARLLLSWLQSSFST